MVETIIWWQNPWYVLIILVSAITGYMLLLVIKHFIAERELQRKKDYNIPDSENEKALSAILNQGRLLDERFETVQARGTKFERECLDDLKELETLKALYTQKISDLDGLICVVRNRYVGIQNLKNRKV